MQVFQLPEGFGGRRCCAAAAAHELVSGGAGVGLLGLVRELCGLSGRNNFIAELLVRGWAGLVYRNTIMQACGGSGAGLSNIRMLHLRLVSACTLAHQNLLGILQA